MHQRLLFPHKQDVLSSSPKANAAATTTTPTMAKGSLLTRHHHIALLAFLTLTLAALLACIARSFASCQSPLVGPSPHPWEKLNQSNGRDERNQLNGLEFIKGKQVILVSHELSLSGGPLLLMELAVLLNKAGGEVKWVTNQKDMDKNTVSQSLESKLVKNGIQVLPARGSLTVQSVKKADLVILNTAVAGKWIDSTIRENISEMLKKTLWWIHEMRGHYFNLEFVKHLPNVGGAMIDSFATADYWKNRTQERLSIAMPPTYVVHLGNSKELTEASEDFLARNLLREHVREALGLNEDDIVFAVINSVSRGKGQDLFLKSFFEAIQLLKSISKQSRKSLHAVVVGCDISAGKYELELRSFVKEKQIEHLVHFVNKTMNVIPYLAATDVLVQNSQARGECFGRITIEAMAFQLPVLGTAAGGTQEIIVNGTTGLLHPVGKDGIPILAKNMLHLVFDASKRLEMGKNGHQRVQEQFMERHMAQRIGRVLQEVLDRAKHHQRSAVGVL